MAAPPNVTTRAMSGKFLMNKSLSDNTDDILRLQGVAWLKRRAIALFALTLTIKHTTDEAGIEHIDVDQVLSGSLSGSISSSSENRTLDWKEREEFDDLFGHVTEKSQRMPVAEITDEFLKKDWSKDTIDDDIVFTDAWSTADKNKYRWQATQTWGFAMVNGERRYVRHTTFTSSDTVIHTRFVYDYVGPI